MDIVPHKRCYKCCIDKPQSRFSKDRHAKDGLKHRCKDCDKEHKQANREQNRERSREYYRENRERILEYGRGHYQANRERILESREPNREQAAEYGREYRKINRERIREQDRERYLEHRESRREYSHKYSRANPHIYAASRQRRAARKRALPDTLTAEQWQYALDYFNGCCAVCERQLKDLFGTHTAAADHWIPLSSEDCPGTVVENMLPLCHGLDGCNSRKGAKLPDEWLTQHFGKRKAKQILERIALYFKTLIDS